MLSPFSSTSSSLSKQQDEKKFHHPYWRIPPTDIAAQCFCGATLLVFPSSPPFWTESVNVKEQQMRALHSD